MDATAAQHTKTIEVEVHFPISTKPDFHHRYTPETTIGTVRATAMTHFNAREEPGSEYFLTDDRDHDRRLPDEDTVGQASGPDSDEIELTLVKDLIQG
jgi:hypothetical protein